MSPKIAPLPWYCALWGSLISIVIANTEKTIFVAPGQTRSLVQYPSLETLRLDAITPQQPSLRTHIEAQFPEVLSPKGPSSWYLLDGLAEGQRYEVRVCWAATQPTAFDLISHELASILDTPGLLKALSDYSDSRPARPELMPLTNSASLLLQIFAAADYFTMNQTLMENVPLVHVDIILDPYLLNIFPRSLVPTAGYIMSLAILGLALSKYVVSWLQRIASSREFVAQKKNS